MEQRNTEPTNKERADRMLATLAAYRKAQSGWDMPPDEADLSDLLADLMHWCKREGIDFAAELERAQENFQMELLDAETEEIEDITNAVFPCANCGEPLPSWQAKGTLCPRCEVSQP